MVQNFIKHELKVNVKITDGINLGSNNKSVLVKLSSQKDKNLIFKNCAAISKELKVSIVEDLLKEEREERKKLLPELFKAKAKGLNAYFKRSKLIIKDKIIKVFKNEINETSDFKQENENTPEISSATPSSKLEDDLEVKSGQTFGITTARKDKNSIFKLAMQEVSNYKAQNRILQSKADETDRKIDELIKDRNKIMKRKQSTNNNRKLEIIRKKIMELEEEAIRINENVSHDSLPNFRKLLVMFGYKGEMKVGKLNLQELESFMMEFGKQLVI